MNVKLNDELKSKTSWKMRKQIDWIRRDESNQYSDLYYEKRVDITWRENSYT